MKMTSIYTSNMAITAMQKGRQAEQPQTPVHHTTVSRRINLTHSTSSTPDLVDIFTAEYDEGEYSPASPVSSTEAEDDDDPFYDGIVTTTQETLLDQGTPRPYKCNVPEGLGLTFHFMAERYPMPQSPSPEAMKGLPSTLTSRWASFGQSSVQALNSSANATYETNSLEALTPMPTSITSFTPGSRTEKKQQFTNSLSSDPPKHDPPRTSTTTTNDGPHPPTSLQLLQSLASLTFTPSSTATHSNYTNPAKKCQLLPCSSLLDSTPSIINYPTVNPNNLSLPPPPTLYLVTGLSTHPTHSSSSKSKHTPLSTFRHSPRIDRHAWDTRQEELAAERRRSSSSSPFTFRDETWAVLRKEMCEMREREARAHKAWRAALIM